MKKLGKLDKKLKEIGFFPYSENDRSVCFLKQGWTDEDGVIHRPIRVEIRRDMRDGNHSFGVFASDNSCRFGEIHCAAPLYFHEYALFYKKTRKLKRKWWIEDHFVKGFRRFIENFTRKER